MEARRAELAGMRIGALRKEARSVGADMDKVEEAIDEAEEPMAAIMELILSAEAEGALESELAQLRTIGALRKRANAAGVDMATVEQTIDEAENPKTAIVELIVKATVAGGDFTQKDAAANKTRPAHGLEITLPNTARALPAPPGKTLKVRARISCFAS
jgi:hypothetical protein